MGSGPVSGVVDSEWGIREAFFGVCGKRFTWYRFCCKSRRQLGPAIV